MNRLVTVSIRIPTSATAFVLFGAFWFVAALLYPVFAQSKHSHRSPELSNIKQLSVALLIYLEDHENVHPPAHRDIETALGDYVLTNSRIFSYDGIPISYNEWLAGTREPFLAKPRVAFYYPMLKRNGIYIGRTDSSAKYLPFNRLNEEEWEPYREGKP